MTNRSMVHRFSSEILEGVPASWRNVLVTSGKFYHAAQAVLIMRNIMRIVLKANRMLGLLKRTCPLMTDVKVRRTLYLSLVKSQLTYATVVWSPARVNLRTILERVQRRATRWILRTRIGEMSYKQRLLTLRLLPLTNSCWVCPCDNWQSHYALDVSISYFTWLSIFGHDHVLSSCVSLAVKGQCRSLTSSDCLSHTTPPVSNNA